MRALYLVNYSTSFSFGNFVFWVNKMSPECFCWLETSGDVILNQKPPHPLRNVLDIWQSYICPVSGLCMVSSVLLWIISSLF